MKKYLLILTHGLALAIGFGAGIYALPILLAPSAPDRKEVSAIAEKAVFTGEFTKDLQDSDRLHWGEGKVFITPETVTLEGKLAPGPDYKLYLSPEFVETEENFHNLKSRMLRVGEVKTFDNFVVHLPEGVDPSKFNSVIVWCEAFSQFITSAQYQ